MCKAKEDGWNTLKFYGSDMQTALINQMKLDSDLREALRHEQFFVVYQAQVDREGNLLGAEALVRWRHPERRKCSCRSRAMERSPFFRPSEGVSDPELSGSLDVAEPLSLRG